METRADRVRWILREKGWSQRELARRADLADSHISLLLNVLGDGVTGAVLQKVARAGGVNLQWLMTGEGERDAVPLDSADPYPARTAALAPFRGSDDPIVREVVARIATGEHYKAAGWDVIRWSRKIVQEIDEAREDARDPTRVQRRAEESDRAVEKHISGRRKNPMPTRK